MGRTKGRGRQSKKPKRKDSRTTRERTFNVVGRNGKRVKNTRNSPVAQATNGTNTDEDNDLSLSTNTRGRGDSGLMLTDPHHLRGDIKLVERAIAKGWNVRRKQMVRRRLEDIVEKTEADVCTKAGVVYSESAADDLAIKAAKVLVQMDGQDQARVAEVNKQPLPPPQPLIGINVNGNANFGKPSSSGEADQRRSSLLGLLERLGVGGPSDGEDRQEVLESRSPPVDRVPRGDGEAKAAESDTNRAADEAPSEADDLPEFDLRGSIVRGSSRRRKD